MLVSTARATAIEKREVFRQDAVNFWNEYKTTGMYVSADEVIAWLETWGEENEQDAPTANAPQNY